MMFKRLSVALVVVLVIVLVGSVQAQGTQPPATISFAIDALGASVGKDLSLADISSFKWKGELFPDTSLGCPKEGQTYAQVQTRGIQYLLTYLDNTYDYRVSSDGKIVILCQVNSAVLPESTVQAGAEATAEATASAATCPKPLDFTVGQTVNVVSFIGNLNVREQPTLTAAKVGQVAGGDSLTVLAGPECGPRGLLWWQVKSGDITGWVAQGRGNLNFLEVPGAEATATPTPGG